MENSVFGSFMAGRNLGLQDRARGLAGMVMNAQDPAKRNSYLAELSGIDPNSANTMRKEFDEQDKADLANFSRTILGVYKKDPNTAKSMYQSGVGRWGDKFRAMGVEPPQDVSQALPFFEQMAFAGTQGKYTGAPILVKGADGKAYYARYSPNGIERTDFQPADNFKAIVGANGEVIGYESRTNTATPTMMGDPGGQGTQQNPPPEQKDTDPMAPHIARINADGEALRRYGLPQDQVNAWMDNQFAEAQKSVQQNGVVIGQQGTPQAPPVRQPVPQAPMGGGQARVSVAPKKVVRDLTAQEIAARGLPVGTVAQIDESTGAIDIKSKPEDNSGKPPTEGELASKGYYDRIIAAEAELTKLEQAGYKPNVRDFYTAGRGALTNWAATSEGQVWRQQQEDWVRAKLRRESGASIPPDEMDREIKTYFPQPGDTKEVIESKKRSRLMAAQQLRTMAGKTVPATGGNAPQAPAGGGVVWVRDANGKLVRKQ